MIHAHLAMVARDRLRPYRTFELGHIFSDAKPQPSERNVAIMVAATARIDEPAWRSTRMRRCFPTCSPPFAR